jgi:hypothetical protein
MTLTGDWEFLTSNLGPLSYLAMIFAFTMGIILMNMVIAVISNKYTEVEARSEIAFWESRLRYIVEVESMKSIDPMSGRMYCFVRGKDEDNNKVKETSDRPDRMSMDEISYESNRWREVGPKYDEFLDWKWHNHSDRPTFLKRMSCFLEMAKWSEIFSISKDFRLCFLGISDSNKGDANWFPHAMARVGLFGIVFVLCLCAVIVTPLGLLTGGYLWEYAVWGGKDEDNNKVSVQPARFSMDEYNEKNLDEGRYMGQRHNQFLRWKTTARKTSKSGRPSFLKRMSCFLEMAKWSEIFSISKGFRLCFLGIKDSHKGDVTWYQHARAWVGLFGIVFVLCLYAVIVTPLGLLTGGYLWAREVKEYIFWGDMHEPKLSGDSKILNKILKEEIDTVKEQINELMKQMKQILDAVAGKKS